MLSLQSFLREGRVVGLCWANQNLKDTDLKEEDGWGSEFDFDDDDQVGTFCCHRSDSLHLVSLFRLFPCVSQAKKASSMFLLGSQKFFHPEPLPY